MFENGGRGVGMCFYLGFREIWEREGGVVELFERLILLRVGEGWCGKFELRIDIVCKN